MGGWLKKKIKQVSNSVSKAVSAVAKVVSNVVQAAIDDPVKTILTVAAIATGQPELIPVINAGDTLAKGGSLEDAAKSAAISYVATTAGQMAATYAAEAQAAATYGTTMGSAQTAALAAQETGFSAPLITAANAVAKSSTAALLSGGDVSQAAENALAIAAIDTTLGTTYNLIKPDTGESVAPIEDRNVLPASPLDVLASSDTTTTSSPLDVLSPIAAPSSGIGEPIANLAEISPTTMTDVSAPTIGTEPVLGTAVVNADGTTPTQTVTDGQVSAGQISPTITQNEDGTYTQAFDDGSTITIDSAGNAISATTTDGETIYPTAVSSYPTDPYAVDNVGTRDEADILTGTTYPTDPYEVDNMGTRDEADILTGTSQDTDFVGAAGKYFQNQFINQLYNQLLQSLFGGASTTTTGGFRSKYLPSNLKPPYQPNTTDAQSLTIPDVGFNIGQQTELASILPQDYLKDKDQDTSSDAFSADAAEFAKQKFLESQFYDAPPEYAADGGLIGHNPQFFSEGGAGIQHRYVKGGGDGTSDSVPAMLASGEFVIPADVVSGLGNGDNDAGASVLDRFMQEIRSHKRSAKPDQLPPDSKGPLSYLKAAQEKKVKKHGRP